jgi:hypothetical protein
MMLENLVLGNNYKPISSFYPAEVRNCASTRWLDAEAWTSLPFIYSNETSLKAVFFLVITPVTLQMPK